jgi:glycosyltransferase involved in cell wall biosynthesis
MNPFFSIVLPTYNRLHSLRRILLPSLERQTWEDYEFVVVDDASIDGTKAFFDGGEVAGEFPRLACRVRYFRNPRNLGSPASRNAGFDAARGRWIYMVEDDLEIRDPEFLGGAAQLTKTLTTTDPKIAVICPKREEFIAGYYRNQPRHLITYGRLSGEVYCDPAQEYSGYVPNAQACSFLLAEVAKTIRYDTKSFQYFREETDFYERVKKAGWRLYYAGDHLRSYHRMDLSAKGGNRKHSSNLRNEYKYIASQYAFLRRHFNMPAVRIVFFVLVRGLKHISNLTHLPVLKNALSRLQL